MSGNLILTMIAISNAVLAVFMIIFLIVAIRNGIAPPNEPNTGAHRPSVAGIGLRQLINSSASSDIAAAIPQIKAAELEYSEKVKVALRNLEQGADPNTIASQFGFSQSEMGILIATASNHLAAVGLHD
jgi:hypothetical protein